MVPPDDFRFRAHVLLVDLDATTSHLMMLVVAGELSGARWDEAFAKQRSAYSAWVNAASGIGIDPMPALDGRPPEEPLTS
jgi:hypothetical protein